jgi:4-hydroxy-tetrahydrodipicolinate synthase
MKSGHPLSGVYAAALTPLRIDWTPDLEALPGFLEFLADRGVHGALIFGTTGEGPSFSLAEREGVWKAALRIRETRPEFRLLAGTGTPSLSETVNLTKTAFDFGYDGVVVLPPYYFRKATDEGLYAWFEQVIQQAVPGDGYLLGYHFPDAAGIGFSLGLLRRLKDAFPVQFAGIKDSSHDPALAGDLGKCFGSDLAVFTGTDSYLSIALQNNAAGCITAPANLISPDLRGVFDAFTQGEDPAEPQARVTALRHVLEKYPPFPAILKALLAHLYGFQRWPVRPPLVDLSSELTEQALSEFTRMSE